MSFMYFCVCLLIQPSLIFISDISYLILSTVHLPRNLIVMDNEMGIFWKCGRTLNNLQVPRTKVYSWDIWQSLRYTRSHGVIICFRNHNLERCFSVVWHWHYKEGSVLMMEYAQRTTSVTPHSHPPKSWNVQDMKTSNHSVIETSTKCSYKED